MLDQLWPMKLCFHFLDGKEGAGKEYEPLGKRQWRRSNRHSAFQLSQLSQLCHCQFFQEFPAAVSRNLIRPESGDRIWRCVGRRLAVGDESSFYLPSPGSLRRTKTGPERRECQAVDLWRGGRKVSKNSDYVVAGSIDCADYAPHYVAVPLFPVLICYWFCCWLVVSLSLPILSISLLLYFPLLLLSLTMMCFRSLSRIKTIQISLSMKLGYILLYSSKSNLVRS